MKEVLITGASSYVGARLYYDLSRHFDTVGTYHNTQLSRDFLRLDTTNAQEVRNLVSKIKPNIIVHVAASASAKWCEEHPKEARDLNLQATQSIVDAAKAVGSGVIFISSFAAQDTSNVYGQTKAESEAIISEMDRWVIIRPSLVIGFSPNTTNDRPFNRLLKNIDEATPAIYDTSWKFQPSYLGHISQVITFVIDREINAETIPVAVSTLKSRFDVASDILSNFHIPVTPQDNHDKTPVIKEDLGKLKELGLPFYDYETVIAACVDEIKHRDKFRV